MDCQEIQKNLSSYLEELLSSEEKKLVEGHLSSCAHCRAELAELQKTKDLLGSLDDVEPPPWLTAKIMARVREENEQRASFFKKFFFPLHIKVPLQALSVILFGVIVFQVYRMVEPEKKVAQVPSPPSVLTEQKALKEETPQGASKSAEALSRFSPQKMPAAKVAAKKAESAQQSSGATAMELRKSRNVPVTLGENAPPMAQAAPEEKNKKEVSGLASVPVQTEASRQRAWEGQPEDAERAAVLSDKKGAEEKQAAPVLKDSIKRQLAYEQLMCRIIFSAPDTSAAKKSAEDILKQLGGKQIETSSQGTTEIIIAELSSEKIKELSEKLKSLGEIKTKPLLSDLPEGTVRVQIEIAPQ
jgi:anti-sigma factor RsiW